MSFRFSKRDAELVESAIIYAYRIGRGSSNRTDVLPDALWTMLLGNFPELKVRMPASSQLGTVIRLAPTGDSDGMD